MASPKDVKTKRAESSKERADAQAILALIKASGQFDESQLADIEDKLTTGGPDVAIDELTAAVQALDSTPEGQARKRDIMASRKADRLSAKYAPFIQAAMAGGDIVTSIAQIKQANRAGAGLKRPAMPAVPDLDPALSGAIRDAQIGTYDSARVAGPARQELQDTYNKDIALAKSIGGGQASTLGALGQVAALRKNRGAASLLPAIDSIQAREQGRLDNLISGRSSLIDQNYRNRFYQYRAAQDQYDKDAAAIGALGSAGRQNLRTGVQSLLNAAPGVAARAEGMFGSMGQTGYNDPYSDYEQSLNQSLTNPTGARPWHRRQAPYIGDQWVEGPAGARMRMRYRPTLSF